MSKLLVWAPDSFMIVVIALIALALIIGLVQPKRALYLLGLVAFLLVSGPLFDAALGFLWNITPLWLILLALPIVIFGVAFNVLRFFLGVRAADHTIGILAADGIIWASRRGVQILLFPFRAFLKRL